MIITDLFWNMVGLGLSLPFTLVLLTNIGIKIVSGDNYELDLKRLGVVYFIALVGWAIFFGIGGA